MVNNLWLIIEWLIYMFDLILVCSISYKLPVYKQFLK